MRKGILLLAVWTENKHSAIWARNLTKCVY